MHYVVSMSVLISMWLETVMHFLVLCIHVTLWLLIAFFDNGSDNHIQLEDQVPLQGKKKSPFKRITGFQVAFYKTLTSTLTRVSLLVNFARA